MLAPRRQERKVRFFFGAPFDLAQDMLYGLCAKRSDFRLRLRRAGLVVLNLFDSSEEEPR
jgi:hypothetical protein